MARARWHTTRKEVALRTTDSPPGQMKAVVHLQPCKDQITAAQTARNLLSIDINSSTLISFMSFLQYMYYLCFIIVTTPLTVRATLANTASYMSDPTNVHTRDATLKDFHRGRTLFAMRQLINTMVLLQRDTIVRVKTVHFILKDSEGKTIAIDMLKTSMKDFSVMTWNDECSMSECFLTCASCFSLPFLFFFLFFLFLHLVYAVVRL